MLGLLSILFCARVAQGVTDQVILSPLTRIVPILSKVLPDQITNKYLQSVTEKEINQLVKQCSAMGNKYLVNTLINMDLLKSEQVIHDALDLAAKNQHWDIVMILGNKSPSAAFQKLLEIDGYLLKCEYIGRLFDELPISKRHLSDERFLQWVEDSALFERNWKRMAGIGDINLDRGLFLFSKSLQIHDHMSAEARQARARSLRKLLFKVKHIDQPSLKIIIFSMQEASFQGDDDFFKALILKDWFKMNQVVAAIEKDEFSHNLSTDKNAFIELLPHIKKQYDLAKNKRFFWIFRCMNLAHVKGHENMEKYLLSRIKKDFSQEREFLDAAANTLAENGHWDILMSMNSYAPDSALNSFLSKYKNGKDFSKYLSFFVDDIKSKETLTDPQSSQKMDLYQKLLNHDLLDITSESLISKIKSGLTDDQLKYLESKKDESELLKCQICMDDKIQCYFSCRKAKTFNHGACQSCFNEIKQRENKCPWCRKKGKTGFLALF